MKTKNLLMTAFSGTLGPKLREGDGQIPEGVYGEEPCEARSQEAAREHQPSEFFQNRAEGRKGSAAQNKIGEPPSARGVLIPAPGMVYNTCMKLNTVICAAAVCGCALFAAVADEAAKSEVADPSKAELAEEEKGVPFAVAKAGEDSERKAYQKGYKAGDPSVYLPFILNRGNYGFHK
jgi:hypothetical protein